MLRVGTGLHLKERRHSASTRVLTKSITHPACLHHIIHYSLRDLAPTLRCYILVQQVKVLEMCIDVLLRGVGRTGSPRAEDHRFVVALRNVVRLPLLDRPNVAFAKRCEVVPNRGDEGTGGGANGVVLGRLLGWLRVGFGGAAGTPFPTIVRFTTCRLGSSGQNGTNGDSLVIPG